MGDQSFYGTSKTVDTSKPFTVVTQFVTADGTDSGALSQINRFYVQGGKTIPNSVGRSPSTPSPFLCGWSTHWEVSTDRILKSPSKASTR